MEEVNESRVWQRVRGTDPDQQLRGILERQAGLRSAYRQLSRRGGKWRLLYEKKERQIACLRGLLRVLSGQRADLPRPGPLPPDPAACFKSERTVLEELIRLSRDPELGDICTVLVREQRQLCCLLLELLGTM